ncbi:uncharacterized protein LOC110020037 [Phalaenopsis equestris]|uniref:uncharacterized protein LOC110020037 n=1 Tax=Phalaenopsis equestris TaxID=78828 RepID=UPI0009E46361|nr:uncharacterized protein LOC110020037 [Phalaenopsis equestris]
MNYNRGAYNLSCHSHPNKLIVGICSLCLKEKLLILASKQEYQSSPFRSQKKKIATVAGKFPNLFKLSPFPATLFDHHRPKLDPISPSSDQSSSILSLEDSFISIKFNGGELTRKEDRSDVDDGSQISMLRWRKRIRYVYNLAQWTWPNKKAKKCHVEVGVNERVV